MLVPAPHGRQLAAVMAVTTIGYKGIFVVAAVIATLRLKWPILHALFSLSRAFLSNNPPPSR